MAIGLSFDTLIEDRPDAAWQAMFEQHWPAYRSWFLRGGVADRPSYLESRRALREHMPELVPIWERLVELAGGGDVEARFLSLWCPPPYIAGCSQAVWSDPRGNDEPTLLRNYDFAPGLLEGNWLATRWRDGRVLALGDCLWGALDGLNESGLAASLSFGGRKVTGTGFGIPLLLRYVLEIAQNTAEAVAVLKRVPVSMSYNVTLLDRQADAATLFLAPDRAPELTRRVATTNFQHHVDWPEHARATRSVERLECLEQRLAAAASAEDVANALLQPPLFQSSYLRGYGTLYTAVYQPRSGRAELRWPCVRWAQSLQAFSAGRRDIVYASGTKPDPRTP